MSSKYFNNILKDERKVVFGEHLLEANHCAQFVHTNGRQPSLPSTRLWLSLEQESCPSIMPKGTCQVHEYLSEAEVDAWWHNKSTALISVFSVSLCGEDGAGGCQLSVGRTCTRNRSCSECLEVGSVTLAHGVAFLSACGMNVHHRCQTKVANLCGINQKLMAEALAMIESTQQVGMAFRGQVPAVSTRTISVPSLLDL